MIKGNTDYANKWMSGIKMMKQKNFLVFLYLYIVIKTENGVSFHKLSFHKTIFILSLSHSLYFTDLHT